MSGKPDEPSRRGPEYPTSPWGSSAPNGGHSPEPEPEPLYDEADILGAAGSLEVGGSGSIPEAIAAEPPTQRAAGRRVRAAAQREMGQLWGSIFFAVDRPAPRIVVLTSSVRGEGVTQIATALAMAGAAANGDQRIALVEANLRHPRLADLLEISASPGLSDVVSGRVGFDQALQIVTLEESNRTLSILTAGSDDPQPLGLLRSRQLKGLMGTLSERFDHVIVDAAATNLYPDPQILGAMSGGVVLVVHTGHTRRETVAEAKKRMELAQAKLLGVVLNQRTYPIPGFIYRKL